MYVCDIDKEAAVSYGFGLYLGDIIRAASGTAILEIGDQLVKIEKMPTINSRLPALKMLLA